MKRVRTAFVAFVPVFLAFGPAAVAQVPLVLPAAEPEGFRQPERRAGGVPRGLSPPRREQTKGLGLARALRRRLARRRQREHDASGLDALHVRREGGAGGHVRRAHAAGGGRMDGDPELRVQGLGKLQLRTEGRRRARRREARGGGLRRTALYTFDDPANDATALALRWEKLRIAVPITVDTRAVTLASIREQLRGQPRFSWQGWNQAASWCARNDITSDEAFGLGRSVHLDAEDVREPPHEGDAAREEGRRERPPPRCAPKACRSRRRWT